jgi:hypothetical protein
MYVSQVPSYLLFYKHTLLCKLTWSVNEHPNFCNQLRGVQIQDVMTTKL